MAYKTLNPTTGKTEKTFKDHSSKEAEERLGKASLMFEQWRRMAFSVRGKHLESVARVLEESKGEFADLITTEMGKPIMQSVGEIEKCAWVARHYAEFGARMLQDEHVDTDAEESFVTYEPLGVILGVMPWNFPFWQVFRFVAPTIMAGNVVVIKHASNVPQCALAIEEVFKAAGVPEGVFQTLLVSSSRLDRLIENDRVAAVTLTGSEKAGIEVARLAGKVVKKAVLELGGSDPFIVLREANLKRAAEMAVEARIINTGQSCIAAKRFIVEKTVAPTFLKLFKEQLKNVTVGDPKNPENMIGPLAKEEILKRLDEQVRSSVKRGAKVEVGGGRMSRRGLFYKPTLLTNVKPDMAVFSEEVFGPVAAFVIAEDDQDAIRLANSSKYGLGAAVWTESKEQAIRIARALDVGTVIINGVVHSDPRLPFGGVKRSGYGRELGVVGIREFVNIKAISAR
jgi:succinate-semialdehyde dehydrogenase/glutarate-semialdehyde dehydrogenase